MEIKKIWLLDGINGIQITEVCKKKIRAIKDGQEKEIIFSKDVEKMSKSTVIRALQDAFAGDR